MHMTATVFGRGHRSRTLLNLLAIFFYSSRHFFVNVLPVLHAFIRVLVFALVF